MQITCDIEINAPVDKVFNVFTDMDKLTDRIAGIDKVEVLEGDSFTTGFKWRETRTMFGQQATEEMWVGEIEQNKMYEVLAESHGVKYRSVYTFTQLDENKTKVEMVFAGEPQNLTSKIMGWVMMPFMSGSTKKALLADMQDLKQVCEQ